MEMEKICLEELRAVKVLGRGGIGTVFLVVKQKADRLLALKVITKSATEKSNADDILRRTETELDIASSLHHPFFSSLVGVVETEKISGFLGEYCPGGDLHSLRHKQPEKTFSESAIRFYAAEIVIALEHLHSQGIAHRDLKPENILIQASGHIMLTDFDLSTRLISPNQLTVLSSRTQISQRSKRSKFASMLSCLKPSQSSQVAYNIDSTSKIHDSAQVSSINSLRSRSNSLVGTEEYVAPEMLNGTGHEFAVDWWALGILLYEFVYGKTPFKGPTKKHTFYNILIKRPQFIGTWSPLRDLIIRLLEKDPSSRLGSRNGAQDIKEHSFFKSLRWDTIDRVSRPPFVPLSNNCVKVNVNNVVGSVIDIEELAEVMNSKEKDGSNSSRFWYCKEKNWVEGLSTGEEIDAFGMF